MVLVDPAFQRAVVAEARTRGIPIIFDEVRRSWSRVNTQQSAVSLLCVGVLLCTQGCICSVNLLHASDTDSGMLQVFSGLWRLGAVSAAQLLGAHPDIACYAKLLTGQHRISITRSAWRHGAPSAGSHTSLYSARC